MHRAKLALLAVCAISAVAPAHSQTSLADQPLFAAANVPGNLALVLSVEFPTAVSVAYTNRTYSSASSYLGYFDPNKCYTYMFTDGTGVNNYFQPASATTTRTCSGQWSGNFLNWATMQTIDPFRWVLTGGYRVIDTTGTTVIEKAWASGQGGTNNFPDMTMIGGATIAGATPFPSSTTALSVRIQGLGNRMRFTVPATSTGISFQGQYYNNTTMSGTPALTRTDGSINFNWDNSAPDPLVSRTNMSVKWTGTLTIPTSGAYTFRARADDTVQLLVNGVSAFNQTGYNGLQNQVSPTYNFTAGQQVAIEVDFSQGGGGSSVVLEWLTPSTTNYAAVGGGSGDLYGTPVAYNGTASAGGIAYEAFVRAKVCDSSVSPLEANCTPYGTATNPTYKPEGLIQQYSNKMRFSAFGYLNDSNILRDGGVLRAQQKFVGPTQPVPGSTPIANVPNAVAGQTTGAEWNATTGVFTLNPDATDASNTATVMGLNTAVTNSGVMNYLNKFGAASGSYKTYDNVSELYYAAIRYFKNLTKVPEWTAVPAGTSQATVSTWVDGFPVITSPPDPILYSCQRNFVLGIGDVHTWADRDVPGNTTTDTVEPTMPSAVVADTSVDAVLRTNQIGVLEGIGSGSLGLIDGYGSCCTGNSALMAGLAYDAHINDIRGRTVVAPAKPQTVDTYWVDVQEGQQYEANNPFYLATKYGGFTVPAGYSASNTTPLPRASWHTNTDGNGGTTSDASPAQPRPDHYYSGGQPAAMQAGLTAAFANIAANITAFTTSFSTALPQVSQTANASFSTQYDSSVWTGEVTASVLVFNATTNAPTLQTPAAWTLSTNLATQFGGNGWSTNRRVVTWDGVSAGVAFRSSGSSQLASTDLAALNTSYVTGNDSSNYLDYLRGDQSNEVGASGGTQAYRKRVKLIGDIVGAQATPVGPPSFPFSDATNPGYAAFKSTWASRRTVVYVGSNDGMMHAINGALLTSAPSTPTTPPLEVDANAGTEMFAYVPRALFQGPHNTPNVDGLASLGNPTFAHHYMLNATPAAYDFDFKNTQGSTASSPDWHSVLIGGLGKGGKAYFAIDVTDPVGMTTGGESAVAAKVLWEFSNGTTGMSGELGYSYGLPLVTKTAKYGWVAIFTSGYNNFDGKGYFIFVNPRTGALLEKVSTGIGSTTGDAGLAHANAFVVDASNGTADSIYAGDMLGNMWRLDLTGTTGSYPAPVRIATLADSGGNAQPVTTVPAIEIDPSTKKRVVMVGTGRLLDTSDIASTAGQSIYAFFDGTNAGFTVTPTTPLAFPYTRSVLANNTNNSLTGVTPTSTQAGWFEDLGVDVSSAATSTAPAHTGTGIAWRVINDPTTFSGSVAFAPIVPSGDPCNPSGQSRALARQYANGLTTVRDPTTLSAVSYVSLSGTITNLRYLSVNGKAVLVVGTDSGGVGQVNINPTQPFSLRRLNWRELQSVD